MALPSMWFLWGLGWLCMPRLTIGLFIWLILGNDILGIILATIGAVLDIES